MKEPTKYPGVGTGVWILKDGLWLLGKRKSSFGAGSWCPPGGKLEMYEEWEDSVRRETLEECGLEIENIRLARVQNDSMPEWGMHFVTLEFAADWKAGEVLLKEPDSFEEWGWFSWDNLPMPLFEPTRNFVKSGYNPLNI